MLIKASNKTRAAEIDDKLNKINDRWQHLFDVIGSKVRMAKNEFLLLATVVTSQIKLNPIFL